MRAKARTFEQCYAIGNEAACWTWIGFRTRDGYGQFGGRKAHRITYEQAKGPIPAGLSIDHLCRNRSCVNPAHLEPVTHRTNMLRGHAPSILGRDRDVCKNGHPRTPANVRMDGTAKVCRTCNREAVARYVARRKASR